MSGDRVDIAEGNLRRSLVLVGLLSLCFLLSLSCSNDNSDNPFVGAITTSRVDPDFQWPLEIGNRWEYRVWYGSFDSEEEAEAYCSDEANSTTFLLEVIDLPHDAFGDTLPCIMTTYYFDPPEFGYIFTSFSWRYQTREGLYEADFIAPVFSSTSQDIPGAHIPKPVKMINRLLNVSPSTQDMTSLGLDDPQADYAPSLLYQYPYNIGNQWIVDAGGYERKQVVGAHMVRVPAGDFPCYFIQNYNSFDGGDTRVHRGFTEGISDVGLVFNEYESWITFTSPENPYGDSYYYLYKMVLVDYKLY